MAKNEVLFAMEDPAYVKKYGHIFFPSSKRRAKKTAKRGKKR